MIWRSFLSQWVVLRRPRFLFGAVLAIVAAGILATVISISTAGQTTAGPGPDAGVSVSDVTAASGIVSGIDGAGSLIGAISLAVAASVVAGEFSNGTIRNLLIREPHRVRLMIGRWLALAGLTALATALAVLASAAAALATAGSRGLDTSAWTSADGLQSLGGALVAAPAATVGYAAIGAALGILLRSPALAVGAGLAWVLPVETILAAAWDEASHWLPGRLLSAVASGGTADISIHAAVLGSALWTLALAAGACTAFARRDVLS